jgi:hypothetical protein
LTSEVCARASICCASTTLSSPSVTFKFAHTSHTCHAHSRVFRLAAVSVATVTCHPADRALDPARFDEARIERLFRAEPSAEDLLNHGDGNTSSNSSSSGGDRVVSGLYIPAASIGAASAATSAAAGSGLTAWGILPSSRKTYKMRPPPRPKARGRRRMTWQQRAALLGADMYGSGDEMDSDDERPECAIM